MEQKKNESHDLEGKRPLFFNIGLVIALSVTIVAFNWKGKMEGMDLDMPADEFEDIFEVPITKIPEPKPPKPKPMPPKPKVKNPQPVLVVDELPESVKEEVPVDMDIDIDVLVDIIEGPPEEIVDQPLVFVETMPSFPGGMDAFYRYVSENITYPGRARKLNISGKVFVEFVIDKDGSIADVKVVKGLGMGCDEVAAEVLKNSPRWNPGKQRGREVKVRMVLPITFRLH